MEVSHQPCPFCPSSDAFSYNSDTGMFKCFSCGADSGNKRGLIFDGETLEPFTPKAIEEGIYLEPYIPDNYRGISKQVMEKHGVYFTKMEGKETVHYTYPNGTKHRELPKQIKISGKVDKFYGQDDYTSGKNITITEGEEDRLSIIEMMGDWPAVSVPGATPSKDFWENARQYLQNFEKIVLSVDSDEPGDKLADKFYRMFPGKVYRVNHGKYKDANDFLKADAETEYKRSWWNANKIKPNNILNTPQDFLDLYDKTPSYEYFETGIPELDKKMLGVHKGALTLILAETGIGKTEVFRYLEWKCLKDTKYSIATCHGEETPLRSLLGLVSYDLEANVTRKDLIEKGGYESQVKDSIKSIGDSGRLYQFSIPVGDGKDEVDEIVSQVRFLRTAMDVDYIFMEPIQDFISAISTSDKESKLTDLMNKLKRLAAEIDVGIVIIAHANKDGDAKYCASIVQSAAYEIRIERDVDAEDPDERNTTKFFVGRKNRTGGGSGPAGSMHFDIDTYMLTPDLGPQEPVFDHTETGKAVGF
jgi:archaellum biogenesis ATPase FlaH/5S rRNA maturation endonuclease (ribonuclease M5)